MPFIVSMLRKIVLKLLKNERMRQFLVKIFRISQKIIFICIQFVKIIDY